MFSDDPNSILYPKTVAIGLALVITGLGFFFFRWNQDDIRKDLLTDASAIVIEDGYFVQLDARVGKGDAIYGYHYQGSEYKEFFGRYIPCRSKRYDETVRNILMQISIKVLVSPTDPNISYPLLTESDYTAYGEEYPEGLRIIYDEYIKCE